MARTATVTKAQLARALAAATAAWGESARVIVNPDRSIVMERRPGPEIAAKAPSPPRRPMVL